MSEDFGRLTSHFLGGYSPQALSDLLGEDVGRLTTSIGLPVVGDPLGSRYGSTDDFEQLPIVRKFHCRLFDLSDKEDIAEFKAIRQAIANGLAAEYVRQDRWRPEDPAPQVWLEWAFLAHNAAVLPRSPSGQLLLAELHKSEQGDDT